MFHNPTFMGMMFSKKTSYKNLDHPHEFYHHHQDFIQLEMRELSQNCDKFVALGSQLSTVKLSVALKTPSYHVDFPRPVFDAR